MNEDSQQKSSSKPPANTAAQRDGSESTSTFSAFILLLGWEVFKFLVSALTGIFNSKSRPSDSIQSHPAKKSERSEDQDLQTLRHASARRRRGTFFVSLAFLIAVFAALGFMFTYWTGGNNMLLGGTLALCLGGFGLSFVLYSHWLMPDKQTIEPRAELPSPPDERDSFAETFEESAEDIRRRGLLKWIIAGAATMIGAMVVSVIRSFGSAPDKSLFDSVWKSGQRLMTLEGKPVSVNALETGSFVVVFPEGSIGDEKAQTMLIRVNPQFLQLPDERKNWAPKGYVAYSRVCTHAGCVVGLYETTSCLLLCPCHQSTFDVLKAADPTGGPAARPLPQLPLYADADGILRAGGGFSEPPGPGFWGMP